MQQALQPTKDTADKIFYLKHFMSVFWKMHCSFYEAEMLGILHGRGENQFSFWGGGRREEVREEGGKEGGKEGGGERREIQPSKGPLPWS